MGSRGCIEEAPEEAGRGQEKGTTSGVEAAEGRPTDTVVAAVEDGEGWGLRGET